MNCLPRTPLRRTTPLARGTTPLRRRRIRQVSAKRAALAPARAKALTIVRRRSGGRCEAQVAPGCTYVATDGHERLTRAAGGSITDPDNILDLCRACHTWAHDHRKAAERYGVLVSRWGSAR